MKIVISNPKTGKTHQKEIEEDKAKAIYGKKIGDIIDGDLLGLSGVKLEITGGSDKEGFPMRADLRGTKRKEVVLSGGTGFHPKEEGERKRKSVRGNTVEEDIEQLNTKAKKGIEKMMEELGEKETETKEEEETEKEEAEEDEETEETEEKEEETEEDEETEEETEEDEEPEKEEKEEEPEAEEEHECEECGKSFKSKQGLSIHKGKAH